MRICLVIPTEIASVGCRLISSYLRSKGHSTRLVFIPNLIPVKNNIRYARSIKTQCSDKTMHMLLELVRGYDLVGFSVLAQFYEPLADISDFIREKLGKPIVFGGIHATMCPESCINHADIVCIGDGEDTLLDIVETIDKGEKLKKVSSILFLEHDQTIKTILRQPKQNLDCYPPPDFSFKEHFHIMAVPGEEKILEITPQNYRKLQKSYPDTDGLRRLVPYKTISARGCPYNCSYCSIGSLNKKVFPFRVRSVKSVISELKQIITSYGDIIDVISFSDDTFLNNSEKWIAEFCESYTDEIKYPFRVLGHPLSINSRKVEMLCKAGCIWFGMGIESLSKNILYDVYNRKTPVDKVIDAANLLVDISRKFDIVPPTFDIILANPYETIVDKFETIKWLSKICRPAKYVLYHLCFFPGSKLFTRAVEDGMINKEDVIHYRSWYSNEVKMETYFNIFYRFLCREKTKQWFLRLLTAKPLFIIGNTVLGKTEWPIRLYKLIKLRFKNLPKFAFGRKTL